MPSWNFARGPAGVRLMLAAGADRGVSAETLLHGSGLDAAALDDPLYAVEAGQELQVARTLQRAVPEADRLGLAVDVGRRTTLGTFGVWGLAILTSPTWGEALALAVRYAQMSSTFLSVDVGVDGSELRVRLIADEVPADVRDFLEARDLASFVVLIPAIMGADAYELQGAVETRLTGEPGAQLKALLPDSSTVRTGRPETVLRVDASLLTRPLPTADRDTMRTCEAECARTMDRRARRTGIADRVRARLLEGPVARCTMRDVARDLHVEERTLRRQLTAAGTSFRAVRDEVCLTLATEMLETMDLSVGEVAHRLGYTDPTSFTHAFRRISGRPPSALRP